MPNLNVRLNDQNHEKWTLHCKANGGLPSTEARMLIEAVLRDTYKSPVATTQCQRRDEQKQKVELFLTLSEIEGIRRITEAQGGTRNGWIVGAVRTRLTNQPAFSDADVKALNESTYALSSHAKTLKQWIKTVDKITMHPTGDVLEKLQASVDSMTLMVTKHCKKVTRLIESDQNRWSIK